MKKNISQKVKLQIEFDLVLSIPPTEDQVYLNRKTEIFLDLLKNKLCDNFPKLLEQKIHNPEISYQVLK